MRQKESKLVSETSVVYAQYARVLNHSSTEFLPFVLYLTSKVIFLLLCLKIAGVFVSNTKKYSWPICSKYLFSHTNHADSLSILVVT